MSEELLPCPHCGKTENVTTWQDDGYWTVVCNFTFGGCGSMGGYRPTEDEAIEAWNARDERICEITETVGGECARWHVDDVYHELSCGHIAYGNFGQDFTHCAKCGAKVVKE